MHQRTKAAASALVRPRRNRHIPGIGLVAGACRAPIGVVAVPRIHLPAILALSGPPLLAVLLPLLRGLVHRIQNAEIMLGVLEVALRHHPVATAGGITAKLEIFLEQLLRRAANANVRPVAVEHVVAVERDTPASAAALVAKPASTATTTTTTGTVIASAHALNIHNFSVTLSIMRTRRKLLRRRFAVSRPGSSPAANYDP